MTSSESSDRPDASPAVSARAAELLRSGLCLLARREVGDGDLAEDLAQEALARTLAALAAGRVRDAAHLGAFARGVARNLIAGWRRQRRRFAGGDFELIASGVPADVPDVLERLVKGEDRCRLRAALEELSPRDRELLALLYVDGLKPEAIAKRLQEPPERVRKRKQRALERLRAAFALRRDPLSRSAGGDD